MSSKDSSQGPRAFRIEYHADKPMMPTNFTGAYKDSIVRKLKEEFGEAANFLNTGKYHVIPHPEMPPFATMSDEIVRDIEKSAYLSSRATVDKANAKMVNTRPRIYARLMGMCSYEARGQLQRHSSFASMDTSQDDPDALWKLLSEQLFVTGLYDASKTRQTTKQALDSFEQTKGMSINAFYVGFKERAERATACGAAVSTGEDLAREWLQKLGPKYAELRKWIDNGLLGKPKTVEEAYNLASGFQVAVPSTGSTSSGSVFATVDSESKKSNKKKKGGKGGSPEKSKSQSQSLRTFECHTCGNEGHKSADCPMKEEIFRQYRKASSTPTKTTLTVKDSEKASHKESKSHDKAPVEELECSDSEGEDGDEEASYAVCIVPGKLKKGDSAYKLREKKIKDLMAKELGIDSMSTANVTGNRAMLTNIRRLDKRRRFEGFAGGTWSYEYGQHKDFGHMYVVEGAPSLLSLGKIRRMKGTRIEYSEEEDSFHVSVNERVYRFANREGRDVYTCDLEAMESSAENVHACLDECVFMAVGSGVETVDQNRRLLSKEQDEACKRVMAFRAGMGFLSFQNTLKLVQGGRVDGINFTAEDVVRAREVYGEPVDSIRGKSHRVNRKRVKYEGRPIGKVIDSSVSMHCDIMFLSGIAFLVSYVKPLMAILCTWVKSRKTADVATAIYGHTGKLSSLGFKVTGVYADGEGAISAIKDELQNDGCKVEIHGTQTFSAEIDVKIKQVKNTVRSILSGLPYMLSLSLLCWAVYFAVSRINMMPTSTTAHSFSPKELMTGRGISVEMDLGAKGGNSVLAFGSMCEVYQKTTNTVQPRTLPGIYLGGTGNEYGTSNFFMLGTGRVLRSDQWQQRPMDTASIRAMDEFAKKGLGPVPVNPTLMYGNRLFVNETNSDEQWEGVDVPSKTIKDVGATLEGWVDATRPATDDDTRMEIVRADDVPDDFFEPDPTAPVPFEEEEQGNGGQVEESHERESELANEPVGRQGWNSPVPAVSTNLPGVGNKEWHSPSPSEWTPRGRKDLPGSPWFLKGQPVVDPSDGSRPVRTRKQPDRYGYSVLWTRSERCMQITSTLALSERRKWRPSASGMSRIALARAEESRSKHHTAYNLTVDKALKTFGKKANLSLMGELTSIDEKGVFAQVRKKDLSAKQVRSIIRSKMFLKEKYLSTGAFDKLKARYVAGGHMQDKTLYDTSETSSPTVSLQSVYLISSIAAKERRKVVSMDIGTAYLNADMTREVLMRVEPKLAKLLSEINPNKYIPEDDGSMVVLLKKALYGCIESAKLWYDLLSNVLAKLGFSVNAKDSCVFNMIKNGKQLTVAVYVDDLFCTSENEADLAWLTHSMKEEFKTVTVNKGKVHSYLGQTFDFTNDGEVSVSMEGYILDVLSECEVRGDRVTPASEDLYEVDDASPALSEDQREIFHSRVMRLMYLAQRARPDILTAVNFLSGRVAKGTSEDLGKLERVLMYLHATLSLKLVLRSTDQWQVLVFVDASFAVHPGARSQSGMVISLGQGAVQSSSTKQKLVSKSSTEAELIGVSDMLPYVIWMRDFLCAQGYKVKPMLFQDNQSTISLIHKGKSTSPRTRHIAIRFFFVKDRVDAGELEIVYEPTETMVADCMTKPLQGQLFRDMRDLLMGKVALSARGA